MNDIEKIETDFILALDDYHHIHETAIHEPGEPNAAIPLNKIAPGDRIPGRPAAQSQPARERAWSDERDTPYRLTLFSRGDLDLYE